MKRFLKKKWHRIPVGIVLVVMALMLVAGSAFAAYTFTGIGVSVDVDEPLQVQYKLDYFVHDNESPGGRWDTSDWQNAVGLVAPIDAFFSAGDEMRLYLRMNNRANSTLTVNTLIGGNTGKFTLGTFPQGQVIAVSDGHDFDTVNPAAVGNVAAAEWASGIISIKINGDVPPDTYSLTFEFTRE